MRCLIDISGELKHILDSTMSFEVDGIPVRDSLGTMSWDGLLSGALPAETVDYADPAHVFGDGSVVVDSVSRIAEQPDSITFNWMYQTGVVALLCAFGILVICYHKEMWQLFNVAGRRMITNRFSEEMGPLFASFMRHVNAIGFLFLSVVLVKVLDINDVGVSQTASLFILPAAMVTFAVIYFLQAGVLMTVGAMTLSVRFAEHLIMLKRVVFAVLTVLAMPMTMLLAVNDGVLERTMYYAVITLIVLSALLLAKKSLTLFLEQKVSILLWILYLCTVELLPLAVLATMMLRN